MENKFNVHDKVIYEGVDVEAIDLIKGQEYTITSISDFGTLSIAEINSDFNLYFNASQFSVDPRQGVLMEEVEQAIQPTAENFSPDGTQNGFESSALDTLADLSVELDDGIEKLIKRAPKFKNKPGSAVVYYKSGATFHISKLESLYVFNTEGHAVIDVIRTYKRDGLDFQQVVTIPSEMLDKVIYRPKDSYVEIEDQPINKEITYTYDDESGSLSYSMNYLSKEINF